MNQGQGAVFGSLARGPNPSLCWLWFWLWFWLCAGFDADDEAALQALLAKKKASSLPKGAALVLPSPTAGGRVTGDGYIDSGDDDGDDVDALHANLFGFGTPAPKAAATAPKVTPPAPKVTHPAPKASVSSGAPNVTTPAPKASASNNVLHANLFGGSKAKDPTPVAEATNAGSGGAPDIESMGRKELLTLLRAKKVEYRDARG